MKEEHEPRAHWTLRLHLVADLVHEDEPHKVVYQVSGCWHSEKRGALECLAMDCMDLLGVASRALVPARRKEIVEAILDALDGGRAGWLLEDAPEQQEASP